MQKVKKLMFMQLSAKAVIALVNIKWLIIARRVLDLLQTISNKFEDLPVLKLILKDIHTANKLYPYKFY
jgi:hypothetical protein